MDLKDALGQVEADCRDLHLGGSKLVLRDSTTLALQRREREPSTPSAFGRASVARKRRRWARSSRAARSGRKRNGGFWDRQSDSWRSPAGIARIYSAPCRSW